MPLLVSILRKCRNACLAHPVLVAGVATGIGIGIYAKHRSIKAKAKAKHDETLHFVNYWKANDSYMNKIAASLANVSTGASVAVSQAVTEGVDIGKGAQAAVNAIGIINIGVSGVTLVKSGYDVFYQWYQTNQTPPLLTIVQLGSSVLLFGSAISNESTSLWKMFTKLSKDTIYVTNDFIWKSPAAVLGFIRKIPNNKDDAFAALTQAGKLTKSINLSAAGGSIKLNGMLMNMVDFISLSKAEVGSFLNNLPAAPPATAAQQQWIQQIWNRNFRNYQLNAHQICLIQSVVGMFTQGTQQTILDILSYLLRKVTADVQIYFQDKYPGFDSYVKFTYVILHFFQHYVDDLEEQYQNWKRTGDKQYYNPFFDKVDINKAKRLVQFFEFAIQTYYTNGGNVAQQLLNYCYFWFASSILDDQGSSAGIKLTN